MKFKTASWVPFLCLDKHETSHRVQDLTSSQCSFPVSPNKQSQFHRAIKSSISLTRGKKKKRIISCMLPAQLEGCNRRRLKNSQDGGCPASSLKRGQLKCFGMTAEVAGGRDEKAQLTTAVHYKQAQVC